ncbi:MAG: hypothetical protein AMXMBFR33_67290 [Candidatus Xenobia bacterium]
MLVSSAYRWPTTATLKPGTQLANGVEILPMSSDSPGVSARLPAGPLLPVDLLVEMPLMGEPSVRPATHPDRSFKVATGLDGRWHVELDPIDPELVIDPRTFDYGMASRLEHKDGLDYRRWQETFHADGSRTVVRDEYRRGVEGRAALELRVDAGGAVSAEAVLERAGHETERYPRDIQAQTQTDYYLATGSLPAHLRTNGWRGLKTWWDSRSRMVEIVSPPSQQEFRKPFRWLGRSLEHPELLSAWTTLAATEQKAGRTAMEERESMVLVGGVPLRKRL